MWSAPNYCYRSGNLASILQLDEHLNREFEVFNEEDAENRTVPTSQCVRYSLYGCLLNEMWEKKRGEAMLIVFSRYGISPHDRL